MGSARETPSAPAPRQALVSKDALISATSHELRTPVRETAGARTKLLPPQWRCLVTHGGERWRSAPGSQRTHCPARDPPRQPPQLNGILGLSEVLAGGSKGSLNAAQMQVLQIIRASGLRLLNITNDLLDAATMKERKLVLKWDKVKLVDVVNEVILVR